MKPEKMWSRDRYRPALHGDDTIYINRVVPGEGKISLFWQSECDGVYDVSFRVMGSGSEWKSETVRGCSATLSGLCDGVDYEITVRCGREYSDVCIARPGFVPGTVVNYLNPLDKKYIFSGAHLCTPSLLRHPDGYLLASMDIYDGGQPQNLTLIFRSDDDGDSWYHYTELFPCYWGKLFMHRGEVYMLSVSTEYGDLLIGKSDDGGKSFGLPTVLFRGSCDNTHSGWHKSSMPILEHCGRLWTGIDYGCYLEGGHASCLLSAPVDADLLDPMSWSMSEPLRYDPMWEGAAEGKSSGFIEGNAVVLPDGGIGNILRYSTVSCRPSWGLAGLLRGNIGEPEKQLEFEKFVRFPGNLSKFDVCFDSVSGKYYSIISKITPKNPVKARNYLALAVSENLEDWRSVCDLLDYSDMDCQKVGFQYISFIFDGDDILYLSRTAFNGAESYHDSNYITFHRIENFRDL